MVLKLYGPYYSTCVQRVVATLKEKNLDFELVPLDLFKGEHKQASFLEKQPFGVVPVLEDDGFLVYESRAICRYLEAKFKGRGTELIPCGTCTEGLKKQALFEQGASIETSYFDPQASGLTFELVFKNLFKWGEVDHARVKQLKEKLASVLDVYEKILSKQAFIGGNEFSLADLNHLPYGNFLFHPNINVGNLILERPHVKAWWEKISKRDSWVQTMKLAGN